MKIVAALLLALLFSGCTVGFPIRGYGYVLRHEIAAANFTQVHINAAMQVYIRQAEEFSVVLHMQQNLFERIETSVENGVFYLTFPSRITVVEAQQRTLFIYAPYLDVIRIISEIYAGVTATIAVDAERLDLYVSGSQRGWARVTFRGNADTLNVNVSGTGSFYHYGHANALYIEAVDNAYVTLRGNADTLQLDVANFATVRALDMRARDVVVNMMGGSNAGIVQVYATETLEATLRGLSYLRYDGEAVVTRDVRGLAEMTRWTP